MPLFQGAWNLQEFHFVISHPKFNSPSENDLSHIWRVHEMEYDAIPYTLSQQSRRPGTIFLKR